MANYTNDGTPWHKSWDHRFSIGNTYYEEQKRKEEQRRQEEQRRKN